jgi:hypothetical protein
MNSADVTVTAPTLDSALDSETERDVAKRVEKPRWSRW